MSASHFTLTPEERQRAERLLRLQHQGRETLARNLRVFDHWTRGEWNGPEIAAVEGISRQRVGQIARRVHAVGKRSA